MPIRRTTLALRTLGVLFPVTLIGCSGGFVSGQLDAGQTQAADSIATTLPIESQSGDASASTTGGFPQTPAPGVSSVPSPTPTPAPGVSSMPSPTPTPTLDPVKAAVSDPNAILSANSGLAMDLFEGRTANGTAILQYTFHGGSNQIWQLVPVLESAYYFLQNPNAGKCVDISGSSNAAGDNIVLSDCNRSGSQQWAVEPNADGTQTLVNGSSGLCLNVPNGSTAVGQQLDQAPCNGGKQQRWTFTVPYPRAGNGFVLFVADRNNTVTSLTMSMLVPPKPASTGTLFLWPGLQPGGVNYVPIDNGVLQPVLTWGGSCAPTAQPTNYTSWWISGQYVNTYGRLSGYAGCFTGPAMAVNVGDTLNISMTLANTTWTQTILDVQTHKQVTYSINMMNQSQNNVEFDIEEYSSHPVSDVIFNNVVFTMTQPQADACVAVRAGANDYVAPGIVSADQKSCTVPKIILRAQGVAATTANP